MLAADIEELTALRARIAAERDSLAKQAETLSGERLRLASLVDARQKAMSDVRARARGRAPPRCGTGPVRQPLSKI